MRSSGRHPDLPDTPDEPDGSTEPKPTAGPDGSTDRHEADLIWEFVDRLNAGETLDVDEIRRRHPELAPEIIRQLESFLDLGTDPDGGGTKRVLGDYRLERQIGRGGMGVVYEAWENSMDRRVALKVLPQAVAADTRAVARFIREAQVAGKLSHPNVVSVYAMGVKDQVPYYAMEYVEGETLAQVHGRLREAEPDGGTVFGKRDDVRYFGNMAEAFAAVAEGLQHAHSRGIVHRDIKPSNLILDREGRLRILDFGLARLEGQEGLTLSGDFVGTPLYMSPEQARRAKVPLDSRTDVYSLGATLYETLSLQPPFRGKDHGDTLSQIIGRDPTEPRKINPRVPRDLETIVLKCLRKDPGDRYGTAEALAQDLRRFMRGDAIEARPQGRVDRSLHRLWARRVPLALAALGVATTTLLLLLAAAWSRDARERAGRRYDALVVGSQRALDLALATKALATIQEQTTSPAWEWSRPFTRELQATRLQQVLEQAEAQLQEAGALLPSRPEAGLGLERAGRLRSAELSDLVEGAHDPMARGVRLLLSGEQEAARIELALARGGLPASPAPVLLLAQSYVLSRQPHAAEEWLERCYAESAPEVRDDLAMGAAEFWFTQRSASGEEARSEKAERIGAWLGRLPDSLWKRQAVLMAAAATDPPSAIAAGDAALALAPEDPVTHCLLASLYANDLADLQRAEEHAKRALAARPEDPGVLNTLAQVFWELGSYQESIDAAEAALAIRPGNPRSLFVLALAKGHQGRRQEAVDIHRALLRRYPGDAAILGFLAEALGGLGKHGESLGAALEAVKASPDSPTPYMFLGNEYRGQGRLKEATEAYERALAIDPSYRWALWGYGRACVLLGDFDKALALLSDAISRSAAAFNSSAGSRVDFCRLLRGIPKARDLSPLDEFIERFEASHAVVQEHARVLECLALAYLHAPRKHDLTMALDYAERAVAASDWGSVGTNVTLSSVRFALGQVGEATLLLEDYLDADGEGEYQDFLQLCRDTLRPDLVSFASVDALLKCHPRSKDEATSALVAFQLLGPTPRRAAILGYLRARLLEIEGRCNDAMPHFLEAFVGSPESPSVDLPEVGACTEGSVLLRGMTAAACRAALETLPPPAVVGRAISALRAMSQPDEETPGLEDSRLIWLLGPFPDRDSLSRERLPFQSIDFHRPVLKTRLNRGETLTWRPLLCASFAVDLEKVLGPCPKASAFLYIEIEAPREVDARVSLEVDDEASFRLNDVEIYRLEGVEGPNRVVFGARFGAGANRMLLEVRNRGGRWSASMRITDPAGSPVPLRQRL